LTSIINSKLKDLAQRSQLVLSYLMVEESPLITQLD